MAYKSNITNPYSGSDVNQDNNPNLIGPTLYFGPTRSNSEYNIPDPSQYLFGTKSSRYQAELNRYNHLMSQREWESQLALMDDEREFQEYIYNKYNSPSAQVAQMRSAGLNPDLQNVSPEGFSPSPASPPSLNSPSMVSGETPLAFDIFMMLPKVASMVTSISSSIIQNDSAKLALDKEYEDMAFRDALDLFKPDDIVNGVINYEKYSEDTKTPDILRLNDFEHEGVSKRYILRYNREWDNLVKGSSPRLVEAIYQKHASGASERSRFINFLGQYGFDMPDKEFAKIIRDLNQIIYESDKESAQYTKDNIKSKAGTKFKSSGMSHIDKGDYFVGVLEYFLGMFLDGQFNVSRTSGPKGNSTSIGF